MFRFHTVRFFFLSTVSPSIIFPPLIFFLKFSLLLLCGVTGVVSRSASYLSRWQSITVQAHFLDISMCRSGIWTQEVLTRTFISLHCRMYLPPAPPTARTVWLWRTCRNDPRVGPLCERVWLREVVEGRGRTREMVGKYFYRKKLSSCDIFIVRLCQAWLSFICAHPWPRRVLDKFPPPHTPGSKEILDNCNNHKISRDKGWVFVSVSWCEVHYVVQSSVGDVLLSVVSWGCHEGRKKETKNL